jgi:hypothetical protein
MTYADVLKKKAFELKGLDEVDFFDESLSSLSRLR